MSGIPITFKAGGRFGDRMTVYVLTAVWANNTEVVGVFSSMDNLNEFIKHKSAAEATGCNYAAWSSALETQLDRSWE